MQEGEKAMWEVANATLSALITACSLIVALLILVSTAMLHGLSLGLETMLFLKLMMDVSHVLMVCIAAILMGTLNARGYYLVRRHHHKPHHDRLCILDRPEVWHGIN